MRIRTTPAGLIAEDPTRGRWAHLAGACDLLTGYPIVHAGRREAPPSLTDPDPKRP